MEPHLFTMATASPLSAALIILSELFLRLSMVFLSAWFLTSWWMAPFTQERRNRKVAAPTKVYWMYICKYSSVWGDFTTTPLFFPRFPIYLQDWSSSGLQENVCLWMAPVHEFKHLRIWPCWKLDTLMILTGTEKVDSSTKVARSS